MNENDNSSKYILIGKTKLESDLILILPENYHSNQIQQQFEEPQFIIPPFMSFANSKISSLITRCCSTNHKSSPWIGPHTILLSAPSGSGKTTLIKQILSTFEKSTPSSSFIVSLTFNENFNMNTPSNNIPFEENDENNNSHPSLQFLHLLSTFVNTISQESKKLTKFTQWFNLSKQIINDNNNNTNTSEIPSLLLIIENIDLLISSFSSQNFTSNELLLSTRYFIKLLHFMTTPLFHFPICLLTTTSLSESLISTKFLGTPGFESIITLPIPQLSDRKIIFQSLLQNIIISNETQQTNENSQNILEKIPLDLANELLEENVNDDNDNDDADECNFILNQWICRCSLLTAGYLPGDLVKIIQRMITISSARRQPNLPVTTNIMTINWNDFLTALNITPPNQLISLQNDLFIGSGTQGGIIVEGRSSKLSWKDFAGYDKEKLYIQSLLNRFSHHESANNLLLNDLGLPRGLLLCGESGTGKSYLARIIAAEVFL